MNNRTTWMLILLALLAGCASDPAAEQKRATQQMQYKMQVYGPACEKLGFKADTDDWRECVQREYEQVIMRQQYQMNYPYWNPYYPPYYYRPYRR